MGAALWKALGSVPDEEGGDPYGPDNPNLADTYVASFKARDKNAAPATKDPFDSQLTGQRFQQQSAQHY